MPDSKDTWEGEVCSATSGEKHKSRGKKVQGRGVETVTVSK